MLSSAGRLSFWPEYLTKITVHADVGLGCAVFISGDEIGNWQHAMRLRCVEGNRWEINLHMSVLNKGAEFKFLVGPYQAGENPDVTQLSWQSGDNHICSGRAAYPGFVYTLNENDFSSSERYRK